MIEALIAGERDPHVLAELARGRLRVKCPRLVRALTGRFDDQATRRLTQFIFGSDWSRV